MERLIAGQFVFGMVCRTLYWKNQQDQELMIVALAPDVPKIIWSLWLQGKDEAPDLVRLNFDRWAALNPDYRLEILDQHDVEVLLGEDDLPVAELSVQVLSDIVRACLLR